MPEATKDRLAAELRAAGLDDMAERAAEGLYDEYQSPLPTPLMELAADLAVKAASGHQGAAALRQRVIGGDFDATDEESEAWWQGPEGRTLAAQLGMDDDD